MGQAEAVSLGLHAFRQAQCPSGQPDEIIDMLIVKHNAAANGFNQWTINGEAFSMQAMRPLYKVQKGKRYRLGSGTEATTSIPCTFTGTASSLWVSAASRHQA